MKLISRRESMRTIKFRGKRIDKNSWICGYYSEIEFCDGKGRNSYIKMDGYAPIEIHPETVGQFTDLFDKNGKEIYEGDILTHSTTKDWQGDVYFKEGAFCITPNGGEYYLNDQRAKNTIVAGNIHDTPKLLNQK